MRRSDYLKKETAIFLCRDNIDRVAAEVFAEENAKASERAGVVWDPEKPTLPKKLRVGVDNCLHPDGERWEGSSHFAAGLAEAVRRYNMMPALRALADEIAGNEGRYVTLRYQAIADRLLSILDGEEKNS